MRWSIYLITDPELSCGRTHSDVVTQAACAGVDVVELRDDTLPPSRLVEIGRIIRDITRDTDVTLIVGDRTDVALDIDADGVRVDVGHVAVARRTVGPDRLVGCAVASTDQARWAQADGASYVLVGPIFAPTDGRSQSATTGAQAVADVKRAVSIPVLAFGGIDSNNVADVIRSGADGVAVTSAIAGSPDIPAAVRGLHAAIQRARSTDSA